MLFTINDQLTPAKIDVENIYIKNFRAMKNESKKICLAHFPLV